MLLEQGVGADDDAGVAADDVEQASGGARRWTGEPVSSATRVPCSAPPSMPRLGELAEHRGDGAVVLRGEHLGGGEQRRLPAGVDHRRASRAARPRSCPSRPRPAAAGASVRRGPGRRRLLAPTSRWPAVSVNGSRASNAASRPPPGGGAAWPLRRTPSRRRCAQRGLQHERLVVAQPPLAVSTSAIVVGRVDPRRRLGGDTQLRRARTSAGSGSGSVVEDVERPRRTSR